MILKFLADFIRKFLFTLNLLFAIYSLLVYQLVFSANIQHWLGGFISLTYPLVIVGNLAFIIIWLLGKSKKVFVSLLILAISIPIKDRTFKLNLGRDTSVQKDFNLLSYNLMYLDNGNIKKKTPTNVGLEIAKAMVEIDADIKCFQEFYSNNEIEQLNMIKRVSEFNPHYVYMHSSKGNDSAMGAIGLATFSKFPVIHREEVYWKTNNNGLLATDIVILKDTVRVINFQLKSMGIRVSKMFNQDRKINKQETRNIFHQLKEGFESRGQEVALLENWIEESPYPVIIAGDMNEMPYGFAYGKLRSRLNNSFEDAGSGFGFTYHQILRFLRIDNQFYDAKKIKVLRLNTLKNYKYSDHYPLLGDYIFI